MSRRTVDFNNQKCFVEHGVYTSGRTRINLVSKDGQQVASVTLDIPGKEKVPKMYIFVKDYRENKGVYSALLKANIIKAKKGSIEVGLEQAFVCELIACRVCDNNIHLNVLCNKCTKRIIKENENN
jgi:hypothetical protein